MYLFYRVNCLVLRYDNKDKEVMMYLIIWIIIVLVVVWIGFLLIGYGVFVGSIENVVGLGI